MFLLIYHFWHFYPHTGKGRGVARWDPARVTPRVKLYMHTKFKICSSKGYSGKNAILKSFSHYHGNHFPKFLANVLSWVKIYHHAKFQSNPPTGLARMMVQTYRHTRQTNRQTDKFCFFSRHATWHKTISGWVSSNPKSLV